MHEGLREIEITEQSIAYVNMFFPGTNTTF